MKAVSLAPVWAVDFFGAILVILASFLCLRVAYRIQRREHDNPLAVYLYWFTGAMFAFALSRCLGHIIKYLLILNGRGETWQALAPVSGSINTITFVVIGSVTFVFHRMQGIINRVNRDRRKLEQTSNELLRLNRQLEHIVFERTRAEMALRLAHDIRNPAAVIGGLVSRLFGDEARKPDEKDRERAEQVMAQARRLEELVRKFESIKPGEHAGFAPIELNGLVEDVLATMEPEIQAKRIRVERRLSPALLVFQGNEQLLKIALIHLVRNGIEATPTEGRLEVETAMAPEGVVFRLRDHGPGIPEETLKRVFGESLLVDQGGTGWGSPTSGRSSRSTGEGSPSGTSPQPGCWPRWCCPPTWGSCGGKRRAPPALRRHDRFQPPFPPLGAPDPEPPCSAQGKVPGLQGADRP